MTTPDAMPYPKPDPKPDPDNAAAGIGDASAGAERRAAILALSVAVLLMAIKFAAYVLTDSSAIFSDAIESIVNVLASAFALFAIHYAHLPADRSHPYGHGKIEFLSAGLEGAMVLLAAAVILFRALLDLYNGHGVQQLDLGLLLIAVAMLVNGVVGWFLVSRGKQTGSIALEADGRHLLSDAVTSAVILGALLLVRHTGVAAIDPICAIAMSAYIAWVGIALVRRGTAGLMDEQDPDDERRTRALLDRHVGTDAVEPRICSFHKLRHRHTGRYHWIDFHLVVPSNWDIARAHEVASRIEHEIEQTLGHADATAHVEPCDTGECPRCRREVSV